MHPLIIYGIISYVTLGVVCGIWGVGELYRLHGPDARLRARGRHYVGTFLMNQFFWPVVAGRIIEKWSLKIGW